MKIAGCGALVTSPLRGVWYRAIPPQHWAQPLSSGHTSTIPSRFGAGSVALPGFESLYLAENQIGALFEVNALFGSFHGQHVPNPLAATTVVPLRVRLGKVADLTRFTQRRFIGMSIEELTGDWRGYRLRRPSQPSTSPYTEVPTQRLGDALFHLPVLEGFLTYSAKVPTLRNLVAFPQKLLPGSSVAYVNPLTKQRIQIP